MRSFLTLALGLYLLPVSAQTFETNAAAPITDQTTLVSPLVVSGLPDSLKSEDFGLEAVCLHVEHESVNRLIITLFAPDGTRVKLTHLNGRDEADHLTNTCFGAEGKYFPLEHPPYYGGYKPVLPLGVVNNGQNPNGVWRLLVSEYQGEDYAGQLVQWSLTFGKHPAPYDTILATSQLPILSFDTHGKDIPTDPKIGAHLRIADNAPANFNRTTGPFNGFDGSVGIELHGSSSATFWQQSFSFETRDAQGDDLNVPLLGMPAGSDWVLHGPFSDKSLLRNAFTFTLADAATEAYVPRARFCEVVLDGSYLGVYTLLEKIKRGQDRVDIDKLRQSDVAGDAITGGYIIKVDRRDAPGWDSSFKPDGGGSVYFNYVEPKASDIRPAQMAYIQAFVDSFEQALACPAFDDPEKGWRQFADEASFVDYFLFQEASKNVDAYRLSGHLFKPRNGKLHAGPLWDFNLAWRNANYVGNEVPVGWTFEGETYGVPFWWEKLLQDAGFVEKLRCRWHVLRQTVLSQRHIFSVIDSLTITLEEAQKRHYDLYPIMGRGIWPNPTPIAKTYAQEIDEMKYWISQRLLWMDARLAGDCGSAVAPAAWVVYPNPVHDQLTVFFEARPPEAAVLELVDMTGRVVVQQTNLVFETVLDVQQVEKGFYLLCYRDKTGQMLRVEKIIRV